MGPSLPMITVKAMQKLRNVSSLELFSARSIQLNYFQELEEALTIVQLDPAVDSEDAELCDCLQKLEDVLTDMDGYLRDAASGEKKVSRCISSSTPMAFNVGKLLDNKIRDYKKRLDDILSDLKAKSNFVEKRGRLAKEYFEQTLRETFSFEPTFDIIGRLEDKENVIKSLLHPSDPSIVHIFGISGIGKTTLAKLVFNDQRVDSYFQLKVWVTTRFDLNLKQLIINLIYSISGEQCGDKNMDELIDLLKDILRSRRCLIMLDDVNILNTDEWFRLFECFEAAESRATVISDEPFPHGYRVRFSGFQLQGLSYRDSFSLFFKVAFGKRGKELNPKLVEIGEQIVEKCGGVPLAVITLGHLLSTTTAEEDWKDIRDTELNNGILPYVILSYNRLTSNLKPCFACCSLFPKDYEFYGVELVQFWMANGLLPSLGIVEDPEGIGMQYLKMLRSKLVFKDFDEENFDAKFKMHGSMHDLSLSLASKEFGLSSFIINDFGHQISQQVSFVRPDVRRGDDADKFLHQSDATQALMLFGGTGRPSKKSSIEAFISRGQYLRTLILKKSSFKELPRGVDNLKNLMYLNLSGNEEVREIPNSICNLQMLQTLMLQDCAQIQELPRDIRLMVGLRTLTITTKQNFLAENGIGSLNSLRHLAIIGCRHLQYLPQGIHLLTSLRTLLIRDCDKLIKLPPSVKYLIMLETLVIVNCKMLQLNSKAEMQRHDGDLQDYLIGTGLSLHQLWITNVVKLEVPPQWLIKRSANTLLHLHIEDCPKFRILPKWFQNLKALETLEILKCPLLSSVVAEEDKYEDPVNLIDSGNLRRVRIESLPQLVKLPWWLLGLSATTLMHLHIEDCKTLEILPKWLLNLKLLKNLEILKCPRFNVNDGVSQCLAGLSATNLVNLHIEDCQILTKTTLLDQWLQNLTSLQNLAIMRCPLVSFSQGNGENHQDHLNLNNGGCLERLWIEGLPKLVELPWWLARLSATTLVHLHIEDCQSLMTFPVQLLQNLSSLQILEILRCPSLELLETNEEANIRVAEHQRDSGCLQLRRLWIVSSPKLVESPLSRWFVRLFVTTLLSLHIEDCPSLEALPEGSQNFTSLRTLEILRCPVLSSLPKEMQNLTALQELDIEQCPLLDQTYFDFSFFYEDWRNTSHHGIQIYIDGERYRRRPWAWDLDPY